MSGEFDPTAHPQVPGIRSCRDLLLKLHWHLSVFRTTAIGDGRYFATLDFAVTATATVEWMFLAIAELEDGKLSADLRPFRLDALASGPRRPRFEGRPTKKIVQSAFTGFRDWLEGQHPPLAAWRALANGWKHASPQPAPVRVIEGRPELDAAMATALANSTTGVAIVPGAFPHVITVVIDGREISATAIMARTIDFLDTFIHHHQLDRRSTLSPRERAVLDLLLRRLMDRGR